MTLSNEHLLFLNQQGLIPGKDEEATAFVARAEFCFHLKEKLEAKLPFPPEGTSSKDSLMPAIEKLKKLYDIAPSWALLYFSNYRLSPWHGGCAWIFQLDKESPQAAFLQLRKAFATSSHYLGFYEREEIISHELVHACRMQFEEPKYEEMLAYQTAQSRFRRWIGPICQSGRESAYFALLLAGLLGLDLYLIVQGYALSLQSFLALHALPFLLICAALFRLSKKHTQLKKAFHNLKIMLPDRASALPVLLRLTDHEIDLFASSTPEEISSYINRWKHDSLRWKAIALAYFPT